MIKAVIFDLDDTLYEEKQFVRGGFEAVARYVSEHYGIDQADFFHKLLSMQEKYGRGQVFDLVLKEVGLYKKYLVTHLIQLYRYHDPELSLYPDAKLTLKQLKDCYKLGLITDGNQRVQRNKIRALGLKNLIDVTIATNCYGLQNQKPATLPYERALCKLKAKPSEAIYVGDNPLKDFVGAKEIGVFTIRLLRGPYKNTAVSRVFDANKTVNRLNDLTSLVEELSNSKG